MATSSTTVKPAAPEQRRIPLSPVEGWSTVVLAAILVLLTVGCIEALDWTPNSSILTSTTLVGMALGFILAKQRFVPQWLADIPALALGILFAFFQTAGADEGGSASALASHLSSWLSVASSAQTSTDNSIFLLFLAVLTMLLGYVSMWLIFRSRSPWLAAIANSIVLLINLNAATDDKIIYAILFMLVTLLLLVRFNLVERMRIWRRKGLRFSPEISWDFMQAGIIFVIFVMLFSSVLPSGPAVGSLANLWNGPQSPWQNLQSSFGRVFRIDGGNGQNRIAFDSSLRLQASVNLPHFVVLTYNSSDFTNTYIQAVALDTYNTKTSQWEENKSSVKTQPLATNQQITPETVAFSKVTQTFHIAVAPDGKNIFAIGEPGSFSVPAIVQSDGIGIVDGDTNGSYFNWLAQTPLRNGQTFTAVSYVSTATDARLRTVAMPGAPNAQGFSSDLLTRYTQLPDNLTNDPNNLVFTTAQDWTGNQPTMFDKVNALVTHFHSDGFTYSAQNDPAPPGFDYATWLLKQKKGFCVWYATGFVLMARSLGIPARVVEGFAPGSFDTKLNQYVVRGSDTHMWAQVYFPGFGWINFEPSVTFSGFNRPSQTVPTPGDTGTGDPKPPRPKITDKGGSTPPVVSIPGVSPTGTGIGGVGNAVTISLSTLLAILLLLALGAVAWWRMLYRSLSPISQTFARMALLGNFAGIRANPSLTATEYGEELAQRIPEQRQAISEITELYVRERWAPDAQVVPQQLSERWRAVRDSLFKSVRLRKPRWWWF